MGKSVIKSMIAGSLIVMLISMIVLTFVFVYNIKSNVESQVFEDMNICVDNVKPVAQLSLDFSTSKMKMMFDASMNQFTAFTKYRFIICKSNGQLVWFDSGLSPSKLKPYVAKAVSLAKDKTHIKSIGLFNNVYGTKTMTYGEIIESYDGSEDTIILCTSKLPSVSSKFIDILLEILVMEIAALVFMAVFLYLFSRNITSPLHKINRAIKEFSKGDFNKRVEYKSDNELGELADNVNNMAESIQNLENMRSAFISDVSHELRTPMTSISGFVGGILDGTIPEDESRKYLEIVLSESKRLSRLVNDLLNISRIESGKIEIHKTKFNITEIAKQVLLKFENDVTKKDINVYFESDSEEIYVYADIDYVTQILINLIHNAVKFAPSHGYIKIRLEYENEKCMVYIENNGDGIDKDKQHLIWERFYKTDLSRSNDKSGVGLGLYIVKKLIDAQNETISVFSEPYKNTVFAFTLDIGY